MDSRYSEAELFKFLDYLGSKGLMNESTANARRVAAQKVLSVLEDGEKTDIRKVNRGDVFQRFTNKHGRDFTPGSLATYRQRFVSALDDFIKYVDNPATFKPAAMPRAPRQSSSGSTERRTSQSRDQDADHSAPRAPLGLLPYPIPLPSGNLAQLSIPPSITDADAERIISVVSMMVKALVVPQPSS